MNILSPQTPPDLYPLPYERRRVDRVLPLAKNQVEALREEGVRTLGDLDDWFMRGGTLSALKGLGPVSEQKVLVAYRSLQETRGLIG